MNGLIRRAARAALVCAIFSSTVGPAVDSKVDSKTIIDADGTVRMPSVTIAPSDYLSPESLANNKEAR